MMDNGGFFERNLNALSKTNPQLCSRLSKLKTTKKHYTFLQSRSGETIPVRIDLSGSRHPLHSMVDPRKEAKRLVESVNNNGVLIFLGLGAAYYAEEALLNETTMVIVLESGLEALAELLYAIDYSHIFSDSRFHLFVNIGGRELEQQIINLYHPLLYGGIKVVPLRSRTNLEPETFTAMTCAVENALDIISSDFSVQSHFGRRWFSNIIKNLQNAEEDVDNIPAIKRAAICAAGPSLSMQIATLREKRKTFFLIATDTSLPCLLDEGLTPDAVISIDCQHYSYYHFMKKLPDDVYLFLDLASPPLLASRSSKLKFFAERHPLTLYISKKWKAMPHLDTSGGNVTFAALSLAEQLGAAEIELYGADYSYPGGSAYAKGSYIYSLFKKQENRFSPIEAQVSAFLFRTPLEKKSHSSWYYETKIMKFYRERLEEKSANIEASLIPIIGLGAPINIRQADRITMAPKERQKTYLAGEKTMSCKDFLTFYKNEVLKLPLFKKTTADFLLSLKKEEYFLFTTILPLAAALKHRCTVKDFNELPELVLPELIELTKSYCIKQIDSVLESY